MRIVVTGSNGYLVRNLKKCFRGHELLHIVRTSYDEEIDTSSTLLGDIRDFNRIKDIIKKFNPDIIFHAAAKISIDECEKENKEMYETNVEGTKNIMMSAPSGSTVIFISSMTVYSEKCPIPVDEKSDCIPPHFYGFTKLLSEQIVRYYANCRDVNYLILRFPGLYGGDRKNGYIYNTAKKAYEDEDIILNTKGLKYWQTISVEEIDKILTNIFRMVKEKSISGTFNVCHNEDTDFIQTAQYIVKALNSNSKVIVDLPTDYRHFPLSNVKLLNTIEGNLIKPYYESLGNYIKELKNEIGNGRHTR